MSTPEQPATPGLTRKQMRDIRNTGATPIVNAEDLAESDPPTLDADAETETDAPSAPVQAEVPAPAPVAVDDTPPPLVAPLPRAAAPVAVHELPGADASVDLGVAPLTRRQARQQERIRTASVPVITPEVAAAHAAGAASAQQNSSVAGVRVKEADAPATDGLAALFGAASAAPVEHDAAPVEHQAPPVEQPEVVEAEIEPEPEAEASAVSASASATDASPEVEREVELEAESRESVQEPVESAGQLPEVPARPDADQSAESDEEADRATVHPQLGAELLAGERARVDLPPSFDQIISRSVTGAVGTGNALILSQTPSAPPLVAPVAATGEILITGSFNLPEGLGSTGHAAGTADGKDVDAVLVDGELPAHSSPTPIAASAAISTVKNGGDIIKPPAPEKGNRLMLTLAITAGVLALALVGVLILAFVTGVF